MWTIQAIVNLVVDLVLNLVKTRKNCVLLLLKPNLISLSLQSDVDDSNNRGSC